MQVRGVGYAFAKGLSCGVAAFALMLAPAWAADPPLPAKAPTARVAPFDWDGLYFGGHVGYSRGHVNNTLSDPAPVGSSAWFGGLYGGVQVGYNHVLSSRILLGVEADVSFPNYMHADDKVWSRVAPTDIAETIDFTGTLRARIGYAFDRWMIYGTGGFAFAYSRYIEDPGIAVDADEVLHWRTGWAAGAGAEVAIAPQWTARLEYLYSSFGSTSVTFPSGAQYRSEFDLHTLRLGLNRKLDVPGGGAMAARADAGPAATPDWEIHAQSTFIAQGYGAFRSPYVGTNSFTPWPQARETATATAYLGMRLWEGGELYFGPELLQGFGLQNTTGAAGYPNGEAQKSNFPYPHYHTSRLFLRHTFGFGGGQETIESEPNKLAGKVDVSRLTVQVGKFPVVDIFDGNAYARDPRKDFMNWSIWAAGAFDYAADKVGLTYGAVADLNQEHWALRAGYFLVSSESNGNNFDMRLFKRGSYVMELETRFALLGRPGKLRTIGWINSTFSGSYREALDNPQFGLDISQTRRGRIKYGYVVNLEQSVTDDIGVFGRWSWNDGKNEIMAFTDIDSSLSGGISIKGKAWGREGDTVGIGGAINALSRDHRDFIAAGGLGVLIGDGRLNYRTERVLETYYALALAKQAWLTFDYQLLVNPAYNADRGPVSIYALRYHAEW